MLMHPMTASSRSFGRGLSTNRRKLPHIFMATRTAKAIFLLCVQSTWPLITTEESRQVNPTWNCSETILQNSKDHFIRLKLSSPRDWRKAAFKSNAIQEWVCSANKETEIWDSQKRVTFSSKQSIWGKEKCSEHPYRIVWILFCLKANSLDSELKQPPPVSQGQSHHTAQMDHQASGPMVPL